MAPLMKAIVVEGGKGSTASMKLAEVPMPEPKAGEIMIRVAAAGMNRADIAQREGLYPPPPGASSILGLEVAGEVVASAGRWRIGDKVCALLGGGGYAEYAICDARHAFPIPAGYSLIEAAGLPEAVLTCYVNLFEHGDLKAGETLMVHGANSGIGVTAIQMAKAEGARVIATARGKARTDQALALGADLAIDAAAEDFEAAAKAAGGVDVILDMIAGPYFEKNLLALNIGGRLVHIASLAGAKVELPIPMLMMKRLVVTGSTLRGRDADEKARIAQAAERKVWPQIDAGQVKAVIDRTFPLAEARKAHDYLEPSGHVGKVVLTV